MNKIITWKATTAPRLQASGCKVSCREQSFGNIWVAVVARQSRSQARSKIQGLPVMLANIGGNPAQQTIISKLKSCMSTMATMQ